MLSSLVITMELVRLSAYKPVFTRGLVNLGQARNGEYVFDREFLHPNGNFEPESPKFVRKERSPETGMRV